MRCGNATVVVSAATEKPIRLEGAESALSGAEVSDDLLKQAGDAAVDEAELITDPQGSAALQTRIVAGDGWTCGPGGA